MGPIWKDGGGVTKKVTGNAYKKKRCHTSKKSYEPRFCVTQFLLHCIPWGSHNIPASIYLPKVGVGLVSLLLTLNIFHTLF